MARIKTKNIPSFDPYDVKKELVELADNYFDVENLDLYESGFLGYYIQSLTHLTSDMLFQNAMAYNEAFMIRALLPSSVYNIATQFDYKIDVATPAQGNFTIMIPLPQEDLLVKIPFGSNIDAEGIPYRVKYDYYVSKDSSGITITSHDPTTGIVQDVKYSIELHNKTVTLVFDIVMWQIEVYFHEINIEDPRLYVFYEEYLSGFTGSIYDIFVSIEGERYKEIPSIYQAKSDERVYELLYDAVNNALTIKFGNGIYGYLPKDGATGYVRLYTTLGANGNIVKEKATFADRLVNNIDGSLLRITGTNNFPIYNGVNGEDIEEIKRHAIENISAAKRLVTEKDFQGFQGVTGLKKIKAIPVLTRNDIIGNEIPFYIVKYDNENNPVPTASIPVLVDENNMYYKKGKTLTYEGVEYKLPFTLVIDDTYDFMIGRYLYTVSSLNITPKLFIKNAGEDVLMGMRQIQAKPYANDNTIVFLLETYKLVENIATDMSAKLTITGVSETYDLTFSKVYDDKTTVILSSEVLDASNIPTEEFSWKIELYYAGELYNDYRGTMYVYRNTEPEVTTDTSFPVISSDYSNTFLGTYSLNISPSGTSGIISVDIEKLSSTDNVGDPILPANLYVEVAIDGINIPMTLSGSSGDMMTFVSNSIDLTSFNTGSLSWEVAVYYKSSLYNTYKGTCILMKVGKAPISDMINADPQLYGFPRIELIHLGLNTIDVETNQDTGDFTFTIQVSKMTFNAPEKMAARIVINANIYNFEYDGLTPEDTVLFKSIPIPAEAIQEGITTFKIELDYDGELHAIYKQSAVLKHDLTPICYSNVRRESTGELYAYGVPVIEKEFYDNNLELIDQFILSEIANYREDFVKTKMLNDRINIKFARTFGKAINMRLNRFNPIITKDYANDFSIEIPPVISVKVYVSRKTSIPVTTIVEECKNVLYTFLTLKSNFHKNIYRSEIARFLHDTVDAVELCEVLEPTDDILFDFNLDNIPKTSKEELFKFCPEYIWFKKEKINIETVFIN